MTQKNLNHVQQDQGMLLRGLLALVRNIGGLIEDRMRIQKAAYLLQSLGATDFHPATFRYHCYGPYSRELSNELHNAVLCGLLEEITKPDFQDPKSYRYRLTEAGEKWLSSAQSTLSSMFPPDEMRKKMEIIKKEDSERLELAATIVFLLKQHKGLLTPKQALDKALDLKSYSSSSNGNILHTLNDLGFFENMQLSA